MKSIRPSLLCISPLHMKHIKNDICKSFHFQVSRGFYGKKTTSKVSCSSHNCVKSFYPPRLLVRKLKRKTQVKLVKLLSTHSVGRKQESGDVTREPPSQNGSDKSKSEQVGSKNEMHQDASCHSIPTYLFSNFSLPTFSDLENSLSIFTNSTNWKTADDKDLNFEMCTDLGIGRTMVPNEKDISYSNSLLDLINNNVKEKKEVNLIQNLSKPQLVESSNVKGEVDCIIEEKLLGDTPSDVIWKTKTVSIGPAVGNKIYPPSDVKMTIVSANRPTHHWNRISKVNLLDEDVEKIQEENISLFTPELESLEPSKNKLENIVPLLSMPEIGKPVEKQESLSLMIPLEMMPVKEGEVTMVTPKENLPPREPNKANMKDGEQNVEQEQFSPMSIVSIMNMIKDTDQMVYSDSNSFNDFLKKGPIEKLPVSSPEPMSVLDILNSVDKSAVIIQNDHYITNHILDSLNNKENEISKAKMSTSTHDFLKFTSDMNKKLEHLKENYEKFKKETSGVERELNKLSESLNDDLLLLNSKSELPFLKKTAEQPKESLVTKSLSNSDFTLLDNKMEKNLLHLISKNSENHLFNENTERENEQVFDNSNFDNNLLLVRNNENEHILADNNVQLSCQGVNSFTCSPSQNITVHQSRQSHNSAKKSQEGKLNVDMATKTVISSSSKPSGSEISIVEVQKFTDKRLPFPFSTETVLQVFGTKEKLTEALSVIEQSKAKVATLNSSEGHKKGNQMSPAFHNMLTSLKTFDEKKDSPIPLIVPVDVVNSTKPIDTHSLSNELLMRQAKHAELVKLARSISASNKAMKIAFTNKPKRIVIRKNQTKTKNSISKVNNDRRPFKESIEKVKIIGPKQIDLILGLSPKESVAKRKSAYFQTTGTKGDNQQGKLNKEKNMIKDVKGQNQQEEKLGDKNAQVKPPVLNAKPAVSPAPKMVDAKTKALVTLKVEEDDGLSLRDRTILKDILDGKYGYQNAFSNKLSRENISTSSNVKKGSSGGKGNGDEPTDEAKMSKMLIEKIKKDSCGPILGNREAIKDCEIKTSESIRSKSHSLSNQKMENLKVSNLDKKVQQEPDLIGKPVIQNVAARITTDLKRQTATSNTAFSHVNDSNNGQNIAVINNFRKQPSKQEIIIQPSVNVVEAHLPKPELGAVAQINDTKVTEFPKQNETVKSEVKQFVKPTIQSDSLRSQKEIKGGTDNVKVSVFIPNSNRKTHIKNIVKDEKEITDNATKLVNKSTANNPLKFNKVLFLKPNDGALMENHNMHDIKITHLEKLKNYTHNSNSELIKAQLTAKSVASEQVEKPQMAPAHVKETGKSVAPEQVEKPQMAPAHVKETGKSVAPEQVEKPQMTPADVKETVKSVVPEQVEKPQLAPADVKETVKSVVPEQVEQPKTAPTNGLTLESVQSKMDVTEKNVKDEVEVKEEVKRPMEHPLITKLPRIKPYTSINDLRTQVLLKKQIAAQVSTEKNIEGNENESVASQTKTEILMKNDVKPRLDTASHVPPVDLNHEFMFNFDKFSKETTPFLDPSLCKECLVAEHRILGFPMLNPARTDYVIKNGVITVDIANNLMLKKQLKGIPSVTTILNSTMGEASKAALAKWRTTMINQLGEVGFKDFYKEQLKKGNEFHGSVHRYLKTLAAGKAEEGSSLTFKSVKEVLDNISDVSVLESQVIHSQLGYRGVVDCIAKYKGTPVVIEWKRSDKPKPTVRHTFDAPLQLSAYIGALNYDKVYNIQVQGAIVVVAYSDGTKADVFNVNMEECKEYWKQWLGRFKSYILANQRFLNPIS